MKFFTALLLSLISAASYADDPIPMPFVYKWQGAYSATFIDKFEDPSDGVVCYVMGASHVGVHYSPDVQFDGNNVGSISCVKVHETEAERAEKKKLYDDAVSEIVSAIKNASAGKSNKK